jgi:ABC-type sugar transport system permease subunit
LAARTHAYTQAASNGGRSNHRATLAVLCGLAAAIAVPLAIELTRRVAGVVLLDAAWAIPVAAVAAVASLMFERGARGVVSRTLEQAGGSRRLMAARVFAVTGICFTLSSALAVGIYEFLLWKESH